MFISAVHFHVHSGAVHPYEFNTLKHLNYENTVAMRKFSLEYICLNRARHQAAGM